jgi:hypothetical protein
VAWKRRAGKGDVWQGPAGHREARRAPGQLNDLAWYGSERGYSCSAKAASSARVMYASNVKPSAPGA